MDFAHAALLERGARNEECVRIGEYRVTGETGVVRLRSMGMEERRHRTTGRHGG